MASSSGLSSSGTSAISKAAGAAASTSKTAAKTTPAKTTDNTPPPDKKSSADKTAPAPSPPSNTNSLSGSSLSNGSSSSLSNNSSSLNGDGERSYSYSRNSSDGYSLSSESRSITTEGTTSLVNHLVNAFGDDSGGGHSSYSSRSGGSDCGAFSERRSENISARTEQQFDHLDIARDQLHSAQTKVERVLDAAIEAKMNHERPVPEKLVKKAEADQEKLIKAEGSLDRATSRISGRQESRRQAKGKFELETRAAEDRLLGKFEGVSPELRQEILRKFKPIIDKDSASRNDALRLEEAAKWFVKTDSRANMLRKEGCERAVKDGESCYCDEESGPRPHQKNESGKAPHPGQQKRLEDRLRKKLSSTEFQDRLRDTDPQKREALLERKLKPLAAQSPKAALDLEREVNSQWGQAERSDNDNSPSEISVGHDQIRRQEAIDRLERGKQKREGDSAQARDPIERSIDKLDQGFVDQTHTTLEHMNAQSVRCEFDLERNLGRQASEIKKDLERTVARGGESSGKARSTLRQLNKAVHRTQLLGFHESRGDSGNTGPNLGGAYSLTGGLNANASFRPAPPMGEAEPWDQRDKAVLLSQRLVV